MMWIINTIIQYLMKLKNNGNPDPKKLKIILGSSKKFISLR